MAAEAPRGQRLSLDLQLSAGARTESSSRLSFAENQTTDTVASDLTLNAVLVFRLECASSQRAFAKALLSSGVLSLVNPLQNLLKMMSSEQICGALLQQLRTPGQLWIWFRRRSRVQATSRTTRSRR